MRAILCSFTTALDDMKRSDQRDHLKVLRVMAGAGRFSVFEATANPTVARTVTHLYHRSQADGGPLLKHDESMGYPWTKVVLTDAGRAALAADQTKEGPA